MALEFAYQPLLDGEVRMIKIEYVENVEDTTKTIDHRPIACFIENVHLPRASENSPDQQFKGRGKTWPELPTQHDFGPLFKTEDHRQVDETDYLTNPNDTLVEAESVLPWRHEWGDYIALSYVWNHPKKPEEDDHYTITVNGSPFKVTPNLYHALKALRRSQRVRQGFKLWIDAICIDQNNLDERGSQVARMRDIYQSAWQVLIWLGPSDQGSKLAFSALHWLSQESKQPKPLENFYRESCSVDMRPIFVMWPKYHSPMKKEVYKALFHFFTRPYWRRMWVVQEVAMGNPNSPVLCGDQCVSWQDIYQAAQLISLDESRFGQEILDSVHQPTESTWSFEVARDRQIQGRTWAPERMWKIQQTMMHVQKDQHDVSVSGWKELIRALSLARDAYISNDKDRVYGVLGLKAVADRVNVEPNYKLSESTIYSHFAAELMSEGDLSILRLASGHGGYIVDNWQMDNKQPPLQQRVTRSLAFPVMKNVSKGPEKIPIGVRCKHPIPSWAVCWVCTPAPTAQLGGIYEADAHLGRYLPGFSRWSRGKSSLTTKGIILDMISSVSASNEKDADIRYPSNTPPAKECVYGDFDAIRVAFWRTIVGDTTAQGGEKAPDSYSWLLEPRLWQRGIAGVWTNGFGLHNFMARNSSLEICGFTLQELVFGRSNFKSRFGSMSGDQFYNATELQRQSYSWAVNAMAWRRVFGTRDGRMGMGSCAAKVGDSIVLLSGCNTPLILREFGEHWKLIGECYVHGVMYGEISSEENELEDITIY